jgi:hypothetical protein
MAATNKLLARSDKSSAAVQATNKVRRTAQRMFLPARPNWGRCRLFTLANMNILLWYLPYAMFSGAWDVALSESDMRTDKEGRPNESRTATNLNN